MEGVYSRLSAQKAERLALEAQDQGYWVEVNPYGTDPSDPRTDFTLLIKPKLPYGGKQKPFARGWAKNFYRDPYKSTHARLYRYASREKIASIQVIVKLLAPRRTWDAIEDKAKLFGGWSYTMGSNQGTPFIHIAFKNTRTYERFIKDAKGLYWELEGIENRTRQASFSKSYGRFYRYASRKDFPPRNATRVWFPLRSRGTLIAQRTGRNWATVVTKKDPSRVIIREAVTVFSTRALMDMYRKQGSPEFGFDSSPVPKLKYAPVQRMPNEMEFHDYYHFFLKKHRKDIEGKWRDPGDYPVTQNQLLEEMDQKDLLGAFIKKHGIPVSHDDNARFREDLWKTLMGRGFYRDPEYRRLLGPPLRLR